MSDHTTADNECWSHTHYANVPEVVAQGPSYHIEDVEDTVDEWNYSKRYACPCTHVDVVVVQYCQGCPKQAEEDYGFRDVVVGFLVGLHKADDRQTDSNQQTVD